MGKGSQPRCEFDPAALVRRIDMTVPGEVAAITPAVAKIMAVVGEMGCSGGKEYDIELAVTEALANAVIHGCRRDPGKAVEITVECDPARGMLIVVRDPGEGFDPATVPSPLVGERLFKRGGRGVYLINCLMDEVRYERGGTEIWMVKR
ncbi:MAG: ATP-binding protein [Acidobacteria bacterium]|nr:ATP-binding protein [Acidobacteriota bacterium]